MLVKTFFVLLKSIIRVLIISNIFIAASIVVSPKVFPCTVKLLENNIEKDREVGTMMYDGCMHGRN